ncbi:recombinase family protein [Rhodococcus sp. NPDC055112]
MSRAYGWADDGIAIVDSEAEVLREMAAELLDGGTLRGLVARLSEQGIATATGKTWQPITIKRSLTNPRIIGKRQSGDKLVRAEAAPILDVRTYNRLIKLLQAPERSRFTGDRTRIHLLGGGIARCGVCGSALYANTSSTRADSYACSIRTGGCGRISVKAEDLEADTIERVLARLSDAKFRRKLTKEINALATGEDAAKQLADLEARFTTLGEDFADGLIERETMRAGTERIRAKKATIELQVQRREVLDDLPEPTVAQVVQWWEEASKRRQRDVVSVLLDHVTVKPTSRRGHAGIDPDRLQHTWK